MIKLPDGSYAEADCVYVWPAPDTTRQPPGFVWVSHRADGTVFVYTVGVSQCLKLREALLPQNCLMLD